MMRTHSDPMSSARHAPEASGQRESVWDAHRRVRLLILSLENIAIALSRFSHGITNSLPVIGLFTFGEDMILPSIIMSILLPILCLVNFSNFTRKRSFHVPYI